MPSHLRLQSSFEDPIATGTYQTSPQLPPKKKQRMSLTSTYMVASTARSKLGREAGRADHNLRRLVGHANLLDSLMVELQTAEREQEAWFNNSVRKASKPEEPRHVQWMDEIAENDEYESDSDCEMDEEDEGMFSILPVRKMKAAAVEISSTELDEDAEFDEESDDEELALTRTPSKHSPPELSYEDEEDSDSEEEEECPSPEDMPLELSEKQRKAIATTSYFDTIQQPQTIIAAAC